MAEIIKLASYKRQRARQLAGTAQATLQAAQQELNDLRAYVEERADQLAAMALQLPPDSDLADDTILMAGEFIDIALLIGGGDPRQCERDIEGLFSA
jgi:hypothetical protein